MELIGADDNSQLIYADALRIKGLGLFQQDIPFKHQVLEQALDIYIPLTKSRPSHFF